MGRVIDTFPDKNNVVRQALIKTATSEFRRPISKLCHIMTPPHDDDAKIVNRSIIMQRLQLYYIVLQQSLFYCHIYKHLCIKNIQQVFVNS